MSIDLDIRSFFRKAPRDWLRRYFAHHGVLADLDWRATGRASIEVLHRAWQSLDEETRLRMTEDFRNVALLASPPGKLAIIDEAAQHGETEGLAEQLGQLEDFHTCAFWTYFERPKYWDGAVFFAAADTKPKRYWRKRINFPAFGRRVQDADADALGEALGRLFMAREGRGAYCTVHPYRRGDRDYYFAYPQDHRQTSIEYDEGQMTKRPYNPAFEIVFVHNDRDRTLNIWHQGQTDRVRDLQVAFARAVLKTEIPRNSPRDTRVYDLDMFARPDFELAGLAKHGIERAEVRRLRLHVMAPYRYSIIIDIGANTPSHVLFDRIRAATQGLAPSDFRVSQAGIRVTFELKPNDKKQRVRNFEINAPSSCSLHNDGYDIVIQRMLVENAIEPRQPREGSDDGDGGEDR
jgi:hypothetical protein